MLSIFDLCALGAAVCWAGGAMLSVSPVRHLGTFAFNRWRMLIVGVLLWVAALAVEGWRTPAPGLVAAMAASGLVGIFVGDSALFAAVNRLGPRRAGVLFALHAVFSAGFGYAVLGERMSIQAGAGAVLTLAGVMIAVLLGRRADEDHAWEADRGRVSIGIGLGLLAALCQSVGTLIAKRVMVEPVGPLTASAIRVSVACGAHLVLLGMGVRAVRAHRPPTLRVLTQTGVNGLIGMGLGMTLVLVALTRGDVGMVAILSSVSPVLLLPLLWLHLGRVPAPGAWFGAALTVGGTALILAR